MPYAAPGSSALITPRASVLARLSVVGYALKVRPAGARVPAGYVEFRRYRHHRDGRDDRRRIIGGVVVGRGSRWKITGELVAGAQSWRGFGRSGLPTGTA